MNNPSMINCPADTWKKVATNITAGNIHKVYTDPNIYLQTYRLTGGTAPTSRKEGALCFENSSSEVILSSSAIDVYIMSLGKRGKVRVDV